MTEGTARSHATAIQRAMDAHMCDASWLATVRVCRSRTIRGNPDTSILGSTSLSRSPDRTRIDPGLRGIRTVGTQTGAFEKNEKERSIGIDRKVSGSRFGIVTLGEPDVGETVIQNVAMNEEFHDRLPHPQCCMKADAVICRQLWIFKEGKHLGRGGVATTDRQEGEDREDTTEKWSEGRMSNVADPIQS